MSGDIWSKLVDTKEKEIEALESQITLRYFLINLRSLEKLIKEREKETCSLVRSSSENGCFRGVSTH